MNNLTQTLELDKPLHPIAVQYFKDNISARDDVLKAYFAYHTQHIRDNPFAHNFTGAYKDCECQWCGRTRELVRWDDLPPQCQDRPELTDIADTIQREEERALALYEKAKQNVPKLVARMGMNGNTLSVLYHTHGYDPETVSSIIDVPPQMMVDFHAAMESEKNRSRAAIVRKVITVKTEN